MGALSFADVFEEALRQARTAPAVAAFSAPPPAPAGSPFVFPRPLAAVPPQWTRSYPRAPRPSHQLTEAQRDAFERFNAFGASLPANFTAEELRREYRQLARRLHPDSPVHLAGASSTDLSRAFIDATESYRCLRTVVDPRH